MLRYCLKKLTDVSEVISQMTKALSTSETSVNFYKTTRRNIPEDSYLHFRRAKT
jgi:hypothetical protein